MSLLSSASNDCRCARVEFACVKCARMECARVECACVGVQFPTYFHTIKLRSKVTKSLKHARVCKRWEVSDLDGVVEGGQGLVQVPLGVFCDCRGLLGLLRRRHLFHHHNLAHLMRR